MITPNPEMVSRAFETLATVLAAEPLPSSSGPRIARAAEFMLMRINGAQAAFKHRDTRNYVHLDILTGQLRIPSTGQAFERGDFTQIPLPEMASNLQGE